MQKAYCAPVRRLLLVSNSTLHGSDYLDHCEAEIRGFLGTSVRRVLFVPYALHDLDGYARKARERFGRMGLDLDSIHEAKGAAEERAAIERAQALFIGGGNTFRLLDALYRRTLLDPIRARVRAGMPYIGTSAGSNVATISIKTTNDMPIVWPPSLQALALVPFNVNPHYLDPVEGSTHMGETREQRLREFHELNSEPVVGLREGALLRVEGNTVEVRGSTAARLFCRGRAPREIAPPARLDELLAESTFDLPRSQPLPQRT
jgi:dipeptidase E